MTWSPVLWHLMIPIRLQHITNMTKHGCPHSSGNEEDRLLGCNGIYKYFRQSLTFWRKTSPPSSRWESKPSTTPAGRNGKLCFLLGLLFDLKMEVMCSSKKSGSVWTTWYWNPECCTLHESLLPWKPQVVYSSHSIRNITDDLLADIWSFKEQHSKLYLKIQYLLQRQHTTPPI